jgi:signal transduction histidine kinase
MPVSTGAAGIPINTGRMGKRRGRTFYGSTSVAWLTALAWLVFTDAHRISGDGLPLAAWVALLALANLMPLPGWRSANFAPDLPIATAASLVLSPAETALVAFLGAFDPRELKGDVHFAKAVWNRSQVGLASVSASLVAHTVATNPDSSGFVVLIALLALAVASAVNYALVATALSIEWAQSPFQVIRAMKLGTPVDFGLTFVAWGVLAAMLSALYHQIGAWALLASLGPVLLGRQVLMRSEMWIEASRAHRSGEQALRQLSNQIEEERTDERRLIAADLHDEVLQPLFRVTLLSHVIKADLASGRLLAIDEDLPELLTAAELASGTLRDLIRDLRRSTLGRGGLGPSLANLIRRVQDQTQARIDFSIARVEVGPPNQIAIYQIAKEAMTNALQHSEARIIRMELKDEEDALRLSVGDDGVGFDPFLAKEGHFGLHIMRERAAAIGGNLYIDSVPGQGCSIVLTVPKGNSESET